MKRLIRSNIGWLLWVILLSLLVLSPLIFNARAQLEEPKEGNISFMPNVIPQLTLTPRTGRNNESFRFEWYNNTFDLELFFNATYKNVTRLFSLKDFEDDFNVTVTYLTNRTESNVQFGWVIDNVENVSDFVHNAWFKIEDSSFNYEEIEIEEIPVVTIMGEEPFEEIIDEYNITRFHLPDNLVLSFEDLRDKGFFIGNQNKTATSVKGFSGKSSWNLDPITYSSPIITAIGGTQVSPLTFWDIWNASNVNGWNVVHNNNGTNIQYAYQARLQLGNGTVAGTTWFNDTNVQLWSDPDLYSVNHQWFIGVTDYAHLQLGVPDARIDKTGKDGIAIYHSQHPYSVSYGFQLGISAIRYEGESTVEAYASKFYGNRSHLEYATLIVGDGTLTLWDNLFGNFILYPLTGGTVDLFDLTFNEGCVFRPYTTDPITIDRITIFDGYRNIGMWYARAYNASNIYQRGGTTQIINTQAITADFRLIDADLQAWTFRWGGVNTGEVWRDYTFDLNITDSSNSPVQNANVTVRHYGQGETQDFTVLTGANGSFATQTLSMGFYNQTGGNTIYDYNDYNLTITHASYATKTFNFTLQEQIKWQISLDTSSYSIGIGSGFILAFMICTVLGLAGIYKIKKH